MPSNLNQAIAFLHARICQPKTVEGRNRLASRRLFLAGTRPQRDRFLDGSQDLLEHWRLVVSGGRDALRGPLPCRTVLVPRERVAHVLRRELIRMGRTEALSGSKPIHAAATTKPSQAQRG